MSDSLPTYDDCAAKHERRQPLSALEEFILDQEPAGSRAEVRFRDGLQAVLAECAANARAGAMEAADDR